MADLIIFISADLRLTVFALHFFFELRVGFTSHHRRFRVGCVFEQILPLLIYYLVSASISLDNRLLMTIIRRLLISARVIRPWFLWVAIPASWCVQLLLLWERVLRLYDFLRFSWLNRTLVLAIDWRFFGSLFRTLSLGLRFLLLDSCLLLDQQQQRAALLLMIEIDMRISLPLIVEVNSDSAYRTFKQFLVPAHFTFLLLSEFFVQVQL